MASLRTYVAALAVSAGVAGAGAAAAQTYDRLVVFGDSLTDNGNLFAASRRTNPPSPPYFQGRFSNGPTFVELLGFGPLGGFGATTGSVNYAFGGARTDFSQNPPGMRVQLQSYLGAGGRFGGDDLVVVYGGANNIFQAIPAAAVSANPVAVLQTTASGAAGDVRAILDQAAGAGAGTFLVPNLPSLGATPQFNASPARDLAEGGGQFFNAALAQQAFAAAAALPGTNIILMDAARADAFIRANPGAFGLSNTTASCLNPTTFAVCAAPDSFFYWDGVHPTAATHRLLAALATDYVSYGARGAATVALGETGLDARERAQAAVLARLETAPEPGAPRFTLALDASETNQGARGPVGEIDRSTAALRFGVDARLRPDLVAGVMVYGDDADTDAGALAFNATSLGADVYFGYRREGLFANLVLGGSSDEYDDYRRATGVGPIVHTADRARGSSLGAKLQAGYRFDLGGGTLSPRAAVSALRAQVDAFSENGPGARHAVREQDIEAVGAEASLRYDAPLGARFTGHVEAGYGDFLSYENEGATALVDNPARPLAVAVEDPGRGGLIDVGLEGAAFGDMRVGLSYRGRFDEDYDSHAALLSVTLRR